MSIEAMRELKTLASVCPELNMANYTEDDVRHLNDWAIEMSLLVEQYALSQQPAQATQAEVPDEQIIAIKKSIRAVDPTQPWGDTLAFARAILAQRPAAVPMTDDARQSAFLSAPTSSGGHRTAFMLGIQFAEAHHGITAQAKKESAA